MSTVLLRTLTRKSTIGFGKFNTWTVGDLIDIKQNKFHLAGIYFKLARVTFTPEVLAEIGITGDDIITKPGKAPEKYKPWVTSHGGYSDEFKAVIKKHRIRKAITTLKDINRGINNKARSQHINQHRKH